MKKTAHTQAYIQPIIAIANPLAHKFTGAIIVRKANRGVDRAQMNSRTTLFLQIFRSSIINTVAHPYTHTRTRSQNGGRQYPAGHKPGHNGTKCITVNRGPRSFSRSLSADLAAVTGSLLSLSSPINHPRARHASYPSLAARSSELYTQRDLYTRAYPRGRERERERTES